MELKEILSIFRKFAYVFFWTLCVVVVAGLAFFVLQPKEYETTFMLNVTRKAVQKTDAYRYDDFYRLQADERFADTVVRWLGDPSMQNAIKTEANAKDEFKSLTAVRLSSQMIQVRVRATNAEAGVRLAKAIATVTNVQTDALNAQQQEESWFTMLASNSVTQLHRISFARMLFLSICLGAFLGFWGVLLKHYFAK